MIDVIGWDVGGVHLKAARAEDGRITRVVQLASPLRGGLERLIAAFGEAKSQIGRADHHVVTMTGELADTFASRPEGVERLAALAARELNDAPVLLYAGPAGLVHPRDARRHAAEIASANWHVCAGLVAHTRTWSRSWAARSSRAAIPTPSASPPASWSTPGWCAGS
jgi:uncharacterized hydantoinase/oxoprolinase family protein